MKKRKPFIVGAGVGAVVLTSMGATTAVAQQTATMGVSVTVQQVVQIASRAMSVAALPIVASGEAQVVAPTAPTAVGRIGGEALGNGSVAATVGAFAFTRNAPVTIAGGTTTTTMACRATDSSTLAVTIAVAAGTDGYAQGGTVGSSCAVAGTGACGIFVLPALTFPTGVGTGGCTTANLTIPLTYATS